MEMNRRSFVITSAAIVVSTRITRGQDMPSTTPAVTDGTIIDAGAISTFSADGVFNSFRQQGFFIIRRDKQLSALSSICTHKGCKVQLQDDKSFICKCHNSHFNADGKVTKGPAVKDLPRLAVATDEHLHLQVDLSQKFQAGHFDQPTTQK